MQKNLTTLLFLFLISGKFLFAQKTYNIHGHIRQINASTGIVNASVFLENTTYGTTTDGRGNYVLSSVPEGSYLLVITANNYSTKTQQIILNQDLKKDMALNDQLNDLPELLVESQSLSLGKVGMREIPGSVTYISSDELTRFNHSNVNDIMKRVPGVNIQEEDGFGLRPNIGLRGSGLERSARITIMEDGILAAPAPYASPSAYYFPTAGRMQGVEVLKGASQIRFGPFTTGGAINFLSTTIPRDLSSTIKLSMGSFGFRNLHAFAGNSFERVGFLVETFQYGADGFKDLPGGQDTGFDKQDYHVKFRINTKPDRRNFQSLTFTAGQTDEVSNETYLGLTSDDFARNPLLRYAASQVDQMNAEQRRLSVQHYAEVPGWFNVITTVYRNDFKRNWYKLQGVVDGRAGLSSILSNPLLFDREYDLLAGSIDSDTASLTMRANNREYYSQGVQTVLDFEFETGIVSHDIHISGRFHQDEEDRFQWEDQYSIEDGIMKLEAKGQPGSQANRVESASAIAGYIFYKLEAGSLSVTPGLRYEHVEISRMDYGKTDSERSKSDLSTRSNSVSAWLPGIGLTYSISQGVNVFGGIHKGFAPSGSKPGTQPESSINYEVGLRRFESRIEGTAVLFLNNYSSLLGQDVAAAGGTGSGEIFNAGTAVTKGVELGLNMDFIGENSNGITLPFAISYTFTDAEFTKDFEADFEEWGSISNGDDLPYIASHQVFTSIGIQHRMVAFFINSKFQSDIRTAPGQGAIDEAHLIPGFGTVDFAANIYVDRSTTVDLSVTNVLDNKYAVASRPAGLRPGMPRMFRLGVNLNF